MSTQNQLPSDTPIGSSLDEIAARKPAGDQHSRRLITGTIIALVFGIGISVIFVIKNQKAKAAAEAFGSASTNEELQAVVDNHPGSAAAGSALIALAANLAEDGKPAEAISTLDTFIADFQTHALVPQALISKATIQAAQNETDAAIATLDTFDANHGTSALAPLASLTRGDILKGAGKLEEAKAVYDLIPSDSLIAGQRDERLRFLNFTPPVEVEPAPEPVEEEATPAVEATPAFEAAPATDAAPAEEAAVEETTEEVVEETAEPAAEEAAATPVE
ncbi:tetratricopeptide repeat protein [Sulfuriroseicoccus oceanibius]|uniref:Tetratricopeptide repeat protein n=1 Tax=Sulfuriroseicoccus oceanibius TaxID=2707525 RepID=A0A6B3LFK6_9BACT|nr:tetratricopeptide repeat protein [Sulfuriroseicoccus oceanibius]QQL44435.1 tetratricopeptide repeat protein [Sulfuriroseicoccus oceanibius]